MNNKKTLNKNLVDANKYCFAIFIHVVKFHSMYEYSKQLQDELPVTPLQLPQV